MFLDSALDIGSFCANSYCRISDLITTMRLSQESNAHQQKQLTFADVQVNKSKKSPTNFRQASLPTDIQVLPQKLADEKTGCERWRESAVTADKQAMDSKHFSKTYMAGKETRRSQPSRSNGTLLVPCPRGEQRIRPRAFSS